VSGEVWDVRLPIAQSHPSTRRRTRLIRHLSGGAGVTPPTVSDLSGNIRQSTVGTHSGGCNRLMHPLIQVSKSRAVF